jgi:hypothetical protein
MSDDARERWETERLEALAQSNGSFQAEVREGLKRLTEQQEAVRAAVAAVAKLLNESEERRRCVWLLNRIGQTMARQKRLFPEREKTFTEIFDSLDSYTNLTFKSTEDLDAVYSFLCLVAYSLAAFDDLDKDGISPEDYRRHIKLIREILDELETLNTGDPPGQFSAADKLLREFARPELREAERKAVRERAAQRLSAGPDVIFARESEQDEELPPNRRNQTHEEVP